MTLLKMMNMETTVMSDMFYRVSNSKVMEHVTHISEGRPQGTLCAMLCLNIKECRAYDQTKDNTICRFYDATPYEDLSDFIETNSEWYYFFRKPGKVL